MRKCPFCAEEIAAEASKCKLCGESLLSGNAGTPRVSRSPASVFWWILGSFAILLPLGMLYAWLCEAIPLVDMILPIAYGGAAGLLAWAIIKFYRVQSAGRALLLAIASGIVAIWTAWTGVIYVWTDYFTLNPGSLLQIAEAVAEKRTVTVGRIPFSGSGLVLAWLTEMGVILWGSIAAMRYFRKDSFFCHHCCCWTGKAFTSPIMKEAGESEELAKAWRNGDFSAFDALQPGKKEENHLQVILHDCEHCEESRLTLIATATRTFRGVFRDFGYILRHPSAAQAVKGTAIETDVVLLEKITISRAEADRFRAHCATLTGQK